MNKIMLTAILLPGLLSGCANETRVISVTPNYDAKFGDTVREALLKQTIHPQAGAVADDVAGLDGKAARESVLLYQSTFKQPPPVANVINIGGDLSGN